MYMHVLYMYYMYEWYICLLSSIAISIASQYCLTREVRSPLFVIFV